MRTTGNAALDAAIREGTVKPEPFITIRLASDSSGVLTLGADKIVSAGGIKIEDHASQSGVLTVGGAIARKCVATIYDETGDLASIDYRDSYCEVGLTGTYEGNSFTINLGRYIVQDNSYNNNSVTLTMLDFMSKFDKKVPDSFKSAFPMTASSMIQNICAAVGVQYGGGLRNGSWQANKAPTGASTTWHELIGVVAAQAGQFARISDSGALCFGWYDKTKLNQNTGFQLGHFTGDTYHADGLIRSQAALKNITITGTELRTGTGSDDVKYLYGQAGYVCKVENTLIEPDEAVITSLATTLGGYLNGTVFRTFDATVRSDPLMEVGDVVTITDHKGNTYSGFCSRVDWCLNSDTTLKCDAESENRNNSDVATSKDKTDDAVNDLKDQIKQIQGGGIDYTDGTDHDYRIDDDITVKQLRLGKKATSEEGGQPGHTHIVTTVDEDGVSVDEQYEYVSGDPAIDERRPHGKWKALQRHRGAMFIKPDLWLNNELWIGAQVTQSGSTGNDWPLHWFDSSGLDDWVDISMDWEAKRIRFRVYDDDSGTEEFYHIDLVRGY